MDNLFLIFVVLVFLWVLFFTDLLKYLRETLYLILAFPIMMLYAIFVGPFIIIKDLFKVLYYSLPYIAMFALILYLLITFYS